MIKVTELLEAFGIDDGVRKNGLHLSALLRANADTVFSEFYERTKRFGSAYQLGDGQIEDLKKAQLSHWTKLFGGCLDKEYVRSALVVGQVHRQNGIEPLYYILAYSIIKTLLMRIIAPEQISSASKGHLMVALEKLISLDMGLAMVGYSDHALFAQFFSPEFSV